MDTRDLINELSGNLKPVKPLPTPQLRFGRWSLFALVCTFAGVVFLGLRPDLGRVLVSHHFVIEGLLGVGVSIFAAFSVFFLSVPGEERTPWTRWLPVVLFSFWIGLLVWRATWDQEAHSLAGGELCARNVLLLSAIPGIFLIWMARRAAPLRVEWLGALSLLSVGALGASGVQFICPSHDSLHILVWHVGPAMLIFLSGLWIGRILFRWFRKV